MSPKSYDLSILISDVFQLKRDVEELKEKVNLLPTKDEFFGWMDKLYGQMQTMTQEHDFTKHQVHRNSRRIETLEKDVKYLQTSLKP